MDPLQYRDSKTKTIVKNGEIKDPVRYAEIKGKMAPPPETQTKLEYPHIFQDANPRKK